MSDCQSMMYDCMKEKFESALAALDMNLQGKENALHSEQKLTAGLLKNIEDWKSELNAANAKIEHLRMELQIIWQEIGKPIMTYAPAVAVQELEKSREWVANRAKAALDSKGA